MLERIQDALRRDAVDEALALAQDWAASAPDDAVAQRTLALALARAGDPAAALFALDQAILLAPEDAGLHFERASLLLRSGGVDEAGAALAQGLELDPNHLPSYLAKAHVALARGDLDEAERLSRTAARIAAEDDPRLLGLDALLALRRGNPDRALALASSASKALPDDPQLLSVLGFAYLAKSHWAFAEQAFRKVSALLPDARALQPLLAQLAAGQDRHEEAVELLAPLLDDPKVSNPSLRRLAGLYAFRAGRAEQALELLQESLLHSPDRFVLQALMQLWARRDDRASAQATLEEALARHPLVNDLWAVRLSMEEPGSEGGEAVLSRWLEALPGSVMALETAMVARDRAADLDGAMRLAERLLEVQPGHALAEQFLVEALLSRDPDAAITRARAIAARPQDPASRAAMGSWVGRLLDRAGRTSEAVAQWQSLHDGMRASRLALPPLAPAVEEWPALATPTPDAPRPILVWGLPGSGVERVVDTLGAAVLRDRYTPQAPEDPLRSPQAAHALRNGSADPAALVARWREQLPARGAAGGNAVDWLTWWDNALLLALRPHLPEGLLLAVVRDPRDMLLDWLATGSPVPLALENPEAAAEWLAQGLEQLADLDEQDLYPHVLLRVDGIVDAQQALAEVLGKALGGLKLAPPPAAQRRLPPGRWRAYADQLAAPFARLTPVAVRLGYVES